MPVDTKTKPVVSPVEAVRLSTTHWPLEWYIEIRAGREVGAYTAEFPGRENRGPYTFSPSADEIREFANALLTMVGAEG